MTAVKAVFIDLDGTLVHDGVISPDDKKAVEDVLSMDIPVIPTTTRMRFSAQRLLKGLQLSSCPFVCLNGARVMGPGWDKNDGLDTWMEDRLDMETARRVSEYADMKGYEITTIFGERKYWKVRRDLPVMLQDEDPVAFTVEKTVEALEWGAPICYMMHTEKNGLDGLKDIEYFAISKLVETTCVHRHHRLGELKALTIYPKGTSKANGIEVVCKKMNISIKDTMAIGDDEVDIDMLGSVGIGIAMGNSPDHVKGSADHITSSCVENGVSHALRKYVIEK